MANNPELLKMPLARDGQKNTIPETATASAGIFSQQYGWQSINALPPQAGGKAVKREDFNGAFNLLGGIAFMAQKGFTFKWSAEQDYYAGCVVIDDTDGLRYECIADVTANSTAPSADATHWQIFSAGAGTGLDAWFRQADTGYAVGDMRCYKSLPYGWYLECTTAGITGSGDITIPSPLDVGDTVTDGAVVWTIRKIGSGTGLPIGTIVPFSGSTVPAGYLVCNGAAVSRAMYPDLFAVVGTKYGAGDGATTFNLPDYRFIDKTNAPVFGNGKALAFTDGSILFSPRTSSSSAMAYTTDAYGKDVGAAQTSGTGLTSGKVAGVATKALLGDTPENSGLTAELPTDPNTIYIIKAFNGQTEDSALIDITQYAQALADLSLLVPPGTIIPSASDNAQDGYLLCDGSAVSRTTYGALFNAIGTKYGAGDGSTTFNLPDYNVSGRFLQGGTTAGQVKAAGLPNITGTHTYDMNNSNKTAMSASACYYKSDTSDLGRFQASINSEHGTVHFDASRSSSVYGKSTTVQPPALTTCCMIKY